MMPNNLTCFDQTLSTSERMETDKRRKKKKKKGQKNKEVILGFLSEFNTKPQQTSKCNDFLITQALNKVFKEKGNIAQRYPCALSASNKGQLLVSPLYISYTETML